jgi:hypothetical protein
LSRKGRNLAQVEQPPDAVAPEAEARHLLVAASRYSFLTPTRPVDRLVALALRIGAVITLAADARS